MMDMYRSTKGSESDSSQFKAMYLRRLKVFIREPRQWFFTISPFINVLTTFLILYSLLHLSENAELKKVQVDFINVMIAIMFPFILNTGYATSSGIYMLLPIEERQQKTRHILRLSGMKTIPYWTGLFFADYTLFLIPTVLFATLVSTLKLEAFSDSIWAFAVTMLGFGFAIISSTYLIASFFNS